LRPAQPLCISQLPAGVEPVRLMADGSPPPPRADEPVSEHGAPSAVTARNPNSRLGRPLPASRGVSPDSQGRVMDQHSAMVPVFVGIDVAKDRLDVHLLPSVGPLPCPVITPAWSG
jgi:hypothetical protein